MKKFITLVTFIISLSGLTGYAKPLDAGSPEITAALNYFKSAQLDDGGFGPGGITEWVVMAIAAAGQDPREWRKNGRSPLDYWREKPVTANPYEWIRMTLVLSAMGEDPRRFDRNDYVQKMKGNYEAGQFGDPLSLRDDYWAVLALVAAGERTSKEVRGSVRFILKHQNPDGSWGASTTGIETCADNTAAAIIALIAAGQDARSKAIVKAFEYLKKSQQSDGGFSYLFMPSNAASDCWAISALWAATKDPAGWRANGNDPISHLLGLQQPDGSFKWACGIANSPLLMTAYAVPSLLGKTYPITPSRSSQVTIGVRVEGERETLLNTCVTLGTSKIANGKGGCLDPLPCPTPLAAVAAAAEKTGIPHAIEDRGGSLYLTRLGSESDGWQYRVNDVLPMTPASDFRLRSGDEVVWFYDYEGRKSPLRILPDRLHVWKEEEIGLRVEHFNDTDNRWHPAQDSVVVVGTSSYPVNDGQAVIVFREKGAHCVYAERAGAIRSAAKTVTVEEKRPIKVRLRLEDNGSRLWDGTVSFCDLDAKDLHGNRLIVRRPVLLGALEAAAKQRVLRYETILAAEGLILVSVNGLAEDNRDGSWWYQVNGKVIFEDVDEYVLNDGDDVLFYRAKTPGGR